MKLAGFGYLPRYFLLISKVFGDQGQNKYPSYTSPQEPGSRSAAVFWSDSNGLWLFGGKQKVSWMYYSDLWCFHIETNTWTFEGGSQGADNNYSIM